MLISNLVWWKSRRPPWKSNVLLKIGRMLRINEIGTGCSRAKVRKTWGLWSRERNAVWSEGGKQEKECWKERLELYPRSKPWPTLKITLKFVFLYFRNNRKAFKQRRNVIGYIFFKTPSVFNLKNGLEEEKEEAAATIQEREITIWARRR